MKTSELIAQLQYCLETFGDIDVVSYKNGKWLGDISKIIHLETVYNAGAPDPRATAEERKAWKENPQLQPNSGWLSVKHIPGFNASQINPETKVRKLYLGPAVVVTP